MRIDAKDFDRVESGRIAVLRDLAFSLEPGSFTCLIGPSGCGKTTTLRIMLGLDRDFRGEVRPPSHDARIAAVFQEPRLLPWRTVEQNVRLALPKNATPDLDTLFETLGLSSMRSSYPEELSLGLARRVALARAFAIDPDVLLLDEPFVSLDEATAKRMRALLLRLWRGRGVTVLMVTHNVREAVALADRLLLIDGRPAHLTGDVPLPLPQEMRTPEHMATLLDDLGKTYPDTLQS
ncbi:NitT/TauT family transport system ATP-binding protein [Breoghania corrubedonensis]|uniref:NitT/TauT family transport system ATP-binding protein n=1 Tax=Breoghania corrubedonensis TaxID=665038 RepID=A0A2T5VE07_9HYPH|nr:NitT/TauT family transport system ATP-binding protein [Breoghania corrubedonensis]